MFDGEDRDWFWYKVRIGLCAFPILLALTLLFFFYLVHKCFPPEFMPNFVWPIIIAAVAVSIVGSFMAPAIFERLLKDWLRPRGRY